jgi:hypothetical protein
MGLQPPERLYRAANEAERVQTHQADRPLLPSSDGPALPRRAVIKSSPHHWQ